jgi:hypothetical protein
VDNRRALQNWPPSEKLSVFNQLWNVQSALKEATATFSYMAVRVRTRAIARGRVTEGSVFPPRQLAEENLGM